MEQSEATRLGNNFCNMTRIDSSSEHDMSTSDDVLEETEHDKVWNSEIGNKRRVISQGDLKYDLNDNVLIVLPFYWKHDKVSKMRTVTGTIVNINSVVLPYNQKEVPKETKLVEDKKTIYSTKTWAKSLIADWRDNPDNSCQTMITSYIIKLDRAYHVTESEIKQIYIISRKKGCLPFNYNLYFSKSEDTNYYDIIQVDYRYVMGKTHLCYKLLADMLRVDVVEITADRVEDYLTKFKLNSGIFIRYIDSDENRRKSGIVHFVVLDHVCIGILDVKFVIKCTSEPVKILAISKIFPFDVRLAYKTSSYHCFHPLEHYNFEILEEKNIDLFEGTEDDCAKEVLREIFSKLKVYIVKKSLCQPYDIDSCIFEDREGDIQIIPINELNSEFIDNKKLNKLGLNKYRRTNYDSQDTIKHGYKYTGISLASYVKGLAYPENESPTQHNNYIFFHSKDYYELTLDPNSKEFFNFVCLGNTQKEFKDPNPKDVILAEPFVCDRGPYSGKINLKWFYPDNEFRLLHLYITTNGMHPHFNNKVQILKKTEAELNPSIKYARSFFLKTPMYLAIFDLYSYGLSRNNPTLNSEFSQAFIKKFLWWDKFIQQQ